MWHGDGRKKMMTKPGAKSDVRGRVWVRVAAGRHGQMMLNIVTGGMSVPPQAKTSTMAWQLQSRVSRLAGDHLSFNISSLSMRIQMQQTCRTWSPQSLAKQVTYTLPSIIPTWLSFNRLNLGSDELFCRTFKRPVKHRDAINLPTIL